MLAFRLALRAVRWRAAASVTVFAVALIAVLAATIGPIYLHAVNETVLSERLHQTRQNERDIFVTRSTLVGQPGHDWSEDVRNLATQAADPRWYAPPVYAESAQVYIQANIRLRGSMAAIDDLCAHLRMTSGRCVANGSANETVISARAARSLHVAVGDVIRPTPANITKPVPLRVVGIYQPIAPNGPFWSPWSFFDAQASDDRQVPVLDAFLVSHQALASRVDHLFETLAANVRLLPARVRLDDVPALRSSVDRVLAASVELGQHEGYANTPVAPTATSQLNSVFDGMSKEMSLSRTLITVSTAQLALLAIFVLYAVVGGTAVAQGPEVALAKLRGRRTRSVLLQGVLPPVLLVLAAAPVAALLSWLVVRLIAAHLLGGPVDVVFPPSAFAVAAVATGGGILAALIAARRIVVSPVGALLRRGGDPSGSSMGLALADAAAVTLAVAGLVELIAGGVLDSGKTDPLSALAPTLLAIAAAVVVLRLLPYVGRAVVRMTRDSRRLTAFLAVRQLVRRPASARALLLVAVALALAAFAVTNWSTARTNRQVRALNDAGASTVLQVSPGPRVYDLRAAVDRADPGGHSMAAAVVQFDNSTPLIAVDTRRFAGVGAWVDANSTTPLPQVLRTLHVSRPPPVEFTGSRLRLTIDLTRHPKYRVNLSVDVVGADHALVEVDFGVIRPGRATYERALPASCAGGCVFSNLALSANTPDAAIFAPNAQAEEIDATVGAQAGTGGTWRPISGFDQPRRWRGDERGIVQLASVDGALSIISQQGTPQGPWSLLESSAVPDTVPAVVSSGMAALYSNDEIHDASLIGLDGNTLTINGQIRSVTLPQLDRFGVMVDFGAALAGMTAPAPPQTQFEVWASPAAPPDLAARLAKQGVHVTGRVHAATYRRQLDRTGPAFADSLFLVAAAAATVLALGATILGGMITARRRGYELAALEVVGVRARTLRRAMATEQGILLGIGLVVGLAAGVVGSVLALPSTPVFVDDTIGPPAQHGLPWGLLGALVGGLLVVFVVTCMIVARLVARQATAGRLREAQQ